MAAATSPATLAQPGVGPGEPALPPLLQLVDREAKPTGEALDRPALHQPQHHLPLARKAPPLTGANAATAPSSWAVDSTDERRSPSLPTAPTATSIPAMFSSIKLLLAVPVSTMSCPQTGCSSPIYVHRNQVQLTNICPQKPGAAHQYMSTETRCSSPVYHVWGRWSSVELTDRVRRVADRDVGGLGVLSTPARSWTSQSLSDLPPHGVAIKHQVVPRADRLSAVAHVPS